MAREAHKQLWSKLATRLQTELRLCDRQDVQNKLSAAFDSVTIMTLAGFEDELRSFLHSEELRAWRINFGPSHLSCCQRVMGYQIKCHEKDTIFSNSWEKTVALNGGHLPQDLDPFRHSEAFLTDFLKTQGMLKAPLIKHFPRLFSTQRWADIMDEQDSAVASPPNCFVVPDTNACIELVTPWDSSTSLCDSLVAY